MPDSPLPPNSRRRSDDPSETDYTMRRRGPNGGFFEGATTRELDHLSEAIERLEGKLERVTQEIIELRLFRARILGQAGVVAGAMSLIVTVALTVLGWFVKGAR